MKTDKKVIGSNSHSITKSEKRKNDIERYVNKLLNKDRVVKHYQTLTVQSLIERIVYFYSQDSMLKQSLAINSVLNEEENI